VSTIQPAPRTGDVEMSGLSTIFRFWTTPPFFSFKKIFIYFVLFQLVRKVFREGLRSMFGELPNRSHTTSTVAELSDLHEFSCESCGYTIFPARGREGKFFPTDFKCPNCEAGKEAFFDVHDVSDPRAVAYREQDEDFEYSVEAVSDSKLDDAPPERGFTRR
jgi:rubredoxin